MRKIKVGIIQQANVADMRINLMNLHDGRKSPDRAGKGNF